MYVQDASGCDLASELLTAAHEIRNALMAGETQAIINEQNRAARALGQSDIFKARFKPGCTYWPTAFELSIY